MEEWPIIRESRKLDWSRKSRPSGARATRRTREFGPESRSWIKGKGRREGKLEEGEERGGPSLRGRKGDGGRGRGIGGEAACVHALNR